MSESRVLKLTKPMMTGVDVLNWQKCLAETEFDPKGIDGIFGADTAQATRDFQTFMKITVDGKVGNQTRDTMNKKLNELHKHPYLKLTTPYMKSAEVLAWQQSLNASKILKYKVTEDSIFGEQTANATKDFQRAEKIEVDGVVGIQSRMAMEKVLAKISVPNPSVIDYLPVAEYPNIPATTLRAINVDLQNVSEVRRSVVQKALKLIYPIGLYVITMNSYNSDLNPNYVDRTKIDYVASFAPSYFTNGRKEFMENHADNQKAIGKPSIGADCSGLAMGLWRVLKVVSPRYDTTANNCLLNACYAIKKEDLKPGDCVGKSGHMAIYVGAGLCCEAVGGAFGIQLTDLNTRKVKNMLKSEASGREVWETHSQWTRFGRPKWY